MKSETTDVQNNLKRLVDSVYLNMDLPSQRIKKQYYKATEAMAKAHHEFDLLNDMKEEGV